MKYSYTRRMRDLLKNKNTVVWWSKYINITREFLLIADKQEQQEAAVLRGFSDSPPLAQVIFLSKELHDLSLGALSNRAGFNSYQTSFRLHKAVKQNILDNYEQRKAA